MANIVKYNSRITLKYDSLTNWNSVKDTFIPLKGEVCIVNPSENLGSGTAEALIKVGNGTDTFGALPYLSAKAADVYDWAKLPYDKFTELLDKGTLTYNGKTYTGTSFATDAELEALRSSLSAVASFKTVNANGTNVVADKVDDILTIAQGTDITVTGDATNDKVTIGHATLDTTETDATGVTMTHSGKYKMITGVTTNSTGHVSEVTTTEFTLPAQYDDSDLKSRTSALEGHFTNGIANKATADAKGNNIENTYATKTALEELSDALADVSNVMNFKGVITTNPTTITKGYDNGDVVIYGSKEYVYNGNQAAGSFVEFGDTSAQNQAIEDLESEVSAIKSYATVSGDSGSATAEVVNDTLAINGDDKITVTVTDANNADKVVISHNKVTKADDATLTDTVKLTPSVNTDAFTAVDSIVYDDYGHVSAVKTKTVTVDVTDINSAISSHKSFSTVKAGSTDLVADAINDTLNVAGGTAISVTGVANTDTMTIAHANVTRSDPTKTTLTPGHGGKFTIAEAVTSNAQGHVTAIQYRDVQLPAAYDDSGLVSRITPLENTTWKTTTRNKVTQAAQGSFTSGLQNTTTGASTLNASDLTVGADVIGYIIWDCGTASTNV